MGKSKVAEGTVAKAPKKRSESSKGSAAGRNKDGCARYRSQNRREMNKARRLVRHIRRRGKDLIALESLMKLEKSLMVFPKEIKSVMLEVLRFHGMMN